ncbi:phage tail protein [Chitinophaga sp.]|jgi:phage tail-like protein|uniref:phage tail protein n=1 Tax=unclassified Chitinophaga TaxID=2619133 RepID=UPI00105FA070
MAKSYPFPKFYFKVSRPEQEFNSVDQIGFTEVSGLDYQVDLIEYRHGNDPNFSKIKMPGLRKFANVTLKKGLIQGFKDANAEFFSWIGDGGKPGSVRKRVDYRKNIVITLNDEEGNPVVAWTLTNAFPVKVAFTDMKADANEVAVETLELAIEDLTVEYK